MELYGQTVSKVFHVKDGTGSDGKGKTWPWRMWSVYLGDNDKKFTYFTSGKKPEPFEGMKIGYLKYTEKQEVSKKDGITYNNYTIDELKVSEESVGLPKPPDTIIQNKPQGRDFEREARGKCLFGFMNSGFTMLLEGNITIEELTKQARKCAEICVPIQEVFNEKT